MYLLYKTSSEKKVPSSNFVFDFFLVVLFYLFGLKTFYFLFTEEKAFDVTGAFYLAFVMGGLGIMSAALTVMIFKWVSHWVDIEGMPMVIGVIGKLFAPFSLGFITIFLSWALSVPLLNDLLSLVLATLFSGVSFGIAFGIILFNENFG